MPDAHAGDPNEHVGQARLVLRVREGVEIKVVAGQAELIGPVRGNGVRARSQVEGIGVGAVRPVFDMATIGNPALAREIGLDRYYIVEPSAPMLREDASYPLTDSMRELVEFAAFDIRSRSHWTEIAPSSNELIDDPMFDDQWALRNTGQSGGLPGADIAAFSAWMLLNEVEPVTVAVLDAGVSASHPELAGQLVEGRNFSDGPPDDWEHGFYDHGTRVAGVVCALQNNGEGITGVAPMSRVMSVRVLNDFNLAFPSDAAPGVVWAVDHGAAVLNMSFGWDKNVLGGVEVLGDAVRYAHESGSLLVASSGNSSSFDVRYPAAFPEVMAVGATNNRDEIWDNSTRGPELSVVAPGEEILLLRWDPFTPTALFQIDNGTSFAAPHVAGAAALLWGAFPDLTNVQVREILESSAVDLGPPGFDSTYGHGRVDLLRALLSIDPGGTYAQPTCFGDYEGDGDIDLNDLLIFLSRFADGVLNADVAPPYGVLDFFDVVEFLAIFGEGCGIGEAGM
ncbi:MAG: S8 family peptidase [Phycisphaerales bacterium JB059]